MTVIGRNRLRTLLSAATVIVSVLILAVLLYTQRDALRDFAFEFRPIPTLLSLLIYSLDLIVVILVWSWIMRSLGIQLPFGRHLRYYCISNIARRIPGTLWYIASRAGLYQADGVPVRDTSVASGVELGVSVLSAVLVSLVFGLPILTQFGVSFVGLATALLISLIIVHPAVIGWVLRKLGSDASLFRYKDLLAWLLAYGLAWVLGGVIVFAISNMFIAVGPERLGVFIGSWALVSVLSTAFFFAPTNFGITELGLSLMLSLVMPASIAVLVAIAVRILLLFYEILWAGGVILLGVALNPRK